ncbi:MAG: ABC transporter permease [Candidatus Eremiobacteraeota bacterium]|nr:ABC transporter permease [Candidatus Eremiobacteraeota bacterium]
MTAFIVRRVVGAIPLLLIISLISYALMGLAPGGASAILGQQARSLSPAARAAYAASLGLDKPWYVQYFYWLKELLLHGSLGRSFVDHRPVIQRIAEKMPITIELVGLALIVTLLIAIPVGVAAARRRNSLFDVGATAIAFTAYGIPVFWLGIVLIDFFALKLGWLPSSGINSLGHEHDPIDRVRHLILPVATLAIVGFAGWMRYQRGAMLEVLNQPYIRTARAKGVPEGNILYRHALRNALIPIVTLLGLSLPALVGGAFFIEFIFSVPGMGYLGINSVFQRDYPTVMGTTMISAAVVILGNLLADVGYALVDPRVRYE